MREMKRSELQDAESARYAETVPVSEADEVAVANRQISPESGNFNRRLCASRSVALGVDFSLQCKLWKMIGHIPPEKRSAIQFFDLTTKFSFQHGILQHILHKQKSPPFVRTHSFPSHRPVCGRLVAFDDGNGHGAMVWEDEWT